MLKNQKNSTKNILILWAIIIGYLLFVPLKNATTIIPLGLGAIIEVLFIVSFATIHGTTLYKLRDFIVFVIITFLVSNIFENISILTGFPFGYYNYNNSLGPKLLNVPIIISPAYIGAGYLSWIIAHILLEKMNTKIKGSYVFFIPFISTFLMIMWDMCIDPTRSTLFNFWTWHNGGSYMGVPFSNYLGWFLCVYVYSQIFSLYLYKFERREEKEYPKLSKSFWLQPILMYMSLGLEMPIHVIVGQNIKSVDKLGNVWYAMDIYLNLTLIFIFTMLFISILAMLTIFRTKKIE